jgi:hypothetical protein
MVAVVAGYAEKARRQTRRFMKVTRRYSLEREARRLMDRLGWPQRNELQIPIETCWVHFDTALSPSWAAA